MSEETGAEEVVAVAEERSGSESLEDLVRYIATQLVDDPDDVEVEVEDRGSSAHITLLVPEGQMGRVIGRQGRIARAMRTVVMIAASRRNLRATLDIEEQYVADLTDPEPDPDVEPEA